MPGNIKGGRREEELEAREGNKGKGSQILQMFKIISQAKILIARHDSYRQNIPFLPAKRLNENSGSCAERPQVKTW